MSGHSKWATTKRRKAVVDAKRSSIFTKLANTISIAAKEGGDPESNFKLRMAIDRARSFSLPKENVEKAIKRGTGELGGQQIEKFFYEGFGPDGIAIILEVITDNRNRAAADIKHILNKHGGALGGPGSVMWLFEQKGVITLNLKDLSEEEELKLIDAGVEDIEREDGITLYTKAVDFKKIKERVEALKLPILEADLEYVAKKRIKPKNEASLINLYEALEDCDDVNNFYTNAEL